MSPRQKANSERTNVFFFPDVMEKLKSLAAEKGTSVSGLIRMIVLEYLTEKSKGPGDPSKSHRNPNHPEVTRRINPFYHGGDLRARKFMEVFENERDRENAALH